MKYLLIDTNIWVRVISQGKPGCEIAHLQHLCDLVNSSKVTLLLPEVVQLEIGKNWRSFHEKVEVEIGKMEKELASLLTKQFWSEILDVQQSLRDFLADQKSKKVAAAKERYDSVQSLLGSERVVILPFTEEINFRGRRRLIAGRMPKPENSAHSDACILESVADFFSKLATKDDHELYFCSENVSDFGLLAKERHIIHPLHKDDLPAATEYCISLEQVMTSFKSNEKASVPSATVIEEALQQRTDDEVEAELEFEIERKPAISCAVHDCYAQRYLFSRYCIGHHEQRFEKLSPEQQAEWREKLEDVLRTLTYREREIFKLRSGLGDGYSYTPSECGRIFKISPQRVGQIEAKVMRRLDHPMRRQALENISPE